MPVLSVTGTIHVHERGFGFVQPVTGPAAFVSPPLLNAFLHDDVVEADVEIAPDGKATATALRLVRRRRHTLCGRVGTRGGARVLRVDRAVANTDWSLTGADGVKDDAFVRCAVVSGADRRCQLVAEVGDANVAVLTLLERFRLAAETAPAVEAAAAALPPLADVIAATLPRRRDLRALALVTIDGESTKDIDDAVGCLPADDDGGLRVVVAIADVAELVTEGSVIDVDARARATTVYLPDRVLPMLPRALSEDRLSLLPHVERLCLYCELRIDENGRVVAVDVGEGVMRSHARLTYDATRAFLDDGDASAVPDEVKPTLRRLRAASARLAVQRAARGGVAVDRGEARVHFDADGAPKGVKLAESTSAHVLIERLMVAANEAVARFCADRALPTLYRVHDAPDLERSVALNDAAVALGLEPGFSRARPLSPLALAAFDAQVTGTAVEPAARLLLRRLLGPARYTPEQGIHFGLAAPLYLHFTSPIRRYADLVVHRLLKRYLRGERDLGVLGAGLGALAADVDDAARRASRAEDERLRVLVATSLVGKIEQRVRGRVVGHKPFGALVQLPGIIATLRREQAAALGAQIDVIISAVDAELGRVEVRLAD